jgi:hypothetical protein
MEAEAPKQVPDLYTVYFEKQEPAVEANAPRKLILIEKNVMFFSLESMVVTKEVTGQISTGGTFKSNVPPVAEKAAMFLFSLHKEHMKQVFNKMTGGLILPGAPAWRRPSKP